MISQNLHLQAILHSYWQQNALMAKQKSPLSPHAISAPDTVCVRRAIYKTVWHWQDDSMTALVAE